MILPDNTPISKIPNLGPASKKMLEGIDVFCVGDIKKLGLPLIYRILKGKNCGASMNLMYGLEAGLKGEHWLSLSPEDKVKLRQECTED